MLQTEVKMANSRCVLYFILALFLPAVSAVVRFTKQPVNVTLKEGVTLASISCTVTELEEATQIVSFEREHHVISDGSFGVREAILENLGLDPANYGIATSTNSDTGAYEYTLNINSPTRNDSSRFRCVVCHMVMDSSRHCDANHKYATSDEVSLTVYYQPADRYPICTHSGRAPTAAPNDSSLLFTEGQPAEFTCTSEIGSPPVQLDWTRNGADESTAKDQMEVSDKAGLRESKLTVTPTKEDNGTVLICTLTSDAYNETDRHCSLPPLYVVPADDDAPGGPISGTNIVIFIVLAVIVVLLIVAIVAALFMRRKKSQETRGHKIEYQPAETGDTGDELKFETHRDLQ